MTQDYKNTREALTSDYEDMVSDLIFKTFLYLLYTGQLLNKYLDIEAKKFGSNRPRVDVMHTLIVHGGVMRQSELSRLTLRSKQSAAELIDGLERDGLIRRRVLRNDRRAKEVIVTEKGLDLLKLTIPHALKVVRRAVPSTLSTGQIQELRTILRQIRNRLVEQIGSDGT